METTQNTSEQETLAKTIEEIRTYEKKNLRVNRIKMICSVISVALCIMIAVLLSINIGQITRDIDDISATMTEAASNINIVAQDLQKINFEELSGSVQLFANAGTETINQIKEATTGLDRILDEAEEAIKNISSINIENLNESIQELHDVLQPLAKLANMFH